jgi:hypothetical protein
MAGSYGESSTTPHAAPSPAAAQRWVTAREVSRESGLREDLVVRFVPTVETPNGPLYGARQLEIAKFVRQLTDIGTPTSTVLAAVEDLNAHPDSELSRLAGQLNRGHPARPARRRTALAAAAAAAAVIALAIAGLVGALLGYSNGKDHSTHTAAPSTVSVPGPPQPVQPAVPAATDAVCAPWAAATNDYRAKEADWAKTDPGNSAAEWSPEQRSINMNVMPVLRQEAADLRGFAAKASDPTLRFLMQLEAAYQEAFADRLPTYAGAGDKRLWEAAIAASVMINSQCYAVARPK